MRPFDPALIRALPSTRGPVAGLAAVGTLAGVVAIAQAVTLAVVVGRVVTGGALAGPLGLLVGLLLARGLLAGLTELVARWAGQRVTGLVRLATLRRWLALPEGSRPSAEVAVTRATEGVSALEPYVARYLPALVTAAVVPALAVLTLAVVDPWSALVVVLTLPLLPVFAALIGRHTQEQTERRWGAMALLAGHFLDVVKGLPTLVTYGRARAQVDVVREVGERHRRATVTTLRTAFLSTAALELLATISVALVAVAVGLRLAYGQMDLVVGLTAILIAPEAYWPVRRVGAEFHNAADGAATLATLVEDGVLFPDPDPDPTPTPDRRHGVHASDPNRRHGVHASDPNRRHGVHASDPDRRHGVHASDPDRRHGVHGWVGLTEVAFAHEGRERTLVDVTLSTPSSPGLTALTGPSGAGKTTVLELLAGLRVPAAGAVCAPSAHLASQRPVILPGTVRTNLLLVGAAHEDDALVGALERVGLWGALAEREGLDTVLGDDGFGLSAGQRARLALARAVLSDAPLVLLDEPTANVATTSVPALHRVIVDLARDRRVVVVTHDPGLAGLADDRWALAPSPVMPSRHRAGGGTRAHHVAGGQETRAHHVAGEGETRAHHVAGRGEGEPGVVAPLRKPRGRRGLVLACLLGGLSVSAGVALTATSGWLIVKASTMPIVLTLMVAIVGVRTFGIARPVLRYAERVISHDVALEELARRRADVFAALVPLTPARLGRRSRGELLTGVVRDLDDVVDERVRVTVPAWSAAIASAVGAALAAWHLPAAGLAVALGALGVAAVGLIVAARERVAQGHAVAERGALQREVTALTSRLLAVQAVRGRDADPDPVLAPVDLAERRQQHAEHRLVTTRAAGIALSWVVVAATTAAVALLVWRAGASLSGPYAALVALVPMALADTWVGVPEIAGARARSRAAAARVHAVTAQHPAVAAAGDHPAPSTSMPALALQGAGARWVDDPSAPLALRPLDLDLAPGARVEVTGPNGSGKSTALALLARQLDPVTGRYAVDGADALDLDLADVRSRVAVVDDEPHAFAGTVRANLALALDDPTTADDRELVAALDAVDLGRWFDTLPAGLDTPLSGLSGGERARLALARALVSSRPVVLLDEPLAHLDDATAARALDGLLAAGDDRPGGARTSYLLVSHRPLAVPGFARATVGAAE